MNSIVRRLAWGLACALILGPSSLCQGRVAYVDAAATGANDGSSWANAHKYLQDALAAAAVEQPVEIRVAGGVYRPDLGAGITIGDRAATFQMINGVTLKGGYAGSTGGDPNARDVMLHETILSGDLIRNDGLTDASKVDNSRQVVTGSGTDRTAVIDGFTVTAGCATASSSEQALGGSGAGMLIDGSSPTILSCRFTGNTNLALGAALLARNASSPVVTGCTFVNNAGAGMSNYSGSNSILINCQFEGNTRSGLANNDSSPAIAGCRFTGNGGSAVSAVGCGFALTDCVFEDSGAGKRESGISGFSSNLSLTGCTFTGLDGEGVTVTNGDLNLSNCTFTGLGGGCVRVDRGDLNLFRCTFTDNRWAAASCSNSLTARECTFTNNGGDSYATISGGSLELENCEFIGNSGTEGGAVYLREDTLIATGCLFSGNSSERGGAAISSRGMVLSCSNCTFADNRGRPNAIGFWFASQPQHARFKQCIFSDGPYPFGGSASTLVLIEVTYSDMQGGYPGEGNMDVDPCFVDPGYWADPNDPTREIGPEDRRSVWVAGDYHLRSQGGHWDRATETWVRDEVTSPCIDAGDPNGPLGAEPFPNGGFVNVGAYGATAEASKSYFGEPVCETQLAGDINGDCNVDQADMDILLLHWLMDDMEPANLPPIVMVTSPGDGSELTSPAPIIFQAVASDPDGTVVRVKYFIEHRTDTGGSLGSTTIYDPEDGWRRTWEWSNIHYDGTHTIWAEALDDMGAKTISPKITATLHRAK